MNSYIFPRAYQQPMLCVYMYDSACRSSPSILTMPTFPSEFILRRWLQLISFLPRPRRRGERWRPCRSGQGQRQRQSRGWQRGRRRSSWLRERKYKNSVELWERAELSDAPWRSRGPAQKLLGAGFELQGQRSSFAPGLFIWCFVWPSSVYASFFAFEAHEAHENLLGRNCQMNCGLQVDHQAY